MPHVWGLLPARGGRRVPSQQSVQMNANDTGIVVHPRSPGHGTIWDNLKKGLVFAISVSLRYS